MFVRIRDFKVLVVDDDEVLLARLKTALQGVVGEVRVCTTANSAVALLERFSPRLLVLDVTLPDGNAFDVLKALAHVRPWPSVVAISGTASPEHAFRLARLGVHTYLSKPFGAEELLEALERALEEPLDLEPLLRDAVGKRSLADVEGKVREVMVDEALARAGGTRRGAARILDVTRQVVQYILRRQDR